MSNALPDPLAQRFTICYKTVPTSNLWVCESGYTSVFAIDRRVKEIKSGYSEALTTFFPYKNYTPNVVQKMGIRQKLTPTVVVTCK